jgi:antitoxin (DNA-binding transcriptional repressor) of toxin-antitoxin stability system
LGPWDELLRVENRALGDLAKLAKLRENGCMKTVNIGTLRNKLSAYLRYVRDGEEIIVRDRDVVVARILPISAPSEEDEEAHLIATGQMRPARERVDWDSFWKVPAGDVPRDVAVEAAIWAKGER